MNKRKFTTAAALVAAVVALLPACGTESGAVDAGDRGQVRLALSLPRTDGAFFTELVAAARAEAATQGVELDVVDAGDDVGEQRSQLGTLARQGAHALIVDAVETGPIAEWLATAEGRRVPVVAADRPLPGADVASTVASDHDPGGRLAAEALAEALEESGPVVVLRGGKAVSASRDRGAGFTARLGDFPGIEVVGAATAGFDRDRGADAMKDLLGEHPDLAGVFAENDEMALGAVRALGDRAGDTVQVVGYDGTRDALAAIARGTLAASVAQQPAELGKVAVRNAVRAARGEPVDARILVPVSLVTADNVADFR
ncbi:substrate-binding domain-containing protein [Streptomyces sp. 549]|uniref:substrate-binding domain-containing protein n=1 Tax=Streptomyces sp. 549 TaxID=3049076 RepID=UPI0024C41F29|nr:substrate-binding domain-containing protein [Streptomyces sp. 549]MDK1476131.1 substrate-binding domain-containing protein [Streptomyces sp. 549]